MYKFLRSFGILLILIPLVAFIARGIIGFSFLSQGLSFDPPAGQIINPDKEDIHFTVVSDTGSFNNTLEKLIREAQTSNPNFMLHLGDFITYRTPEHIYWMMGEILPRLKGTPIYFTPGNHDVTRHNGVDYSAYNQVLGTPSYWFGYGNTLFISLDSSSRFISDKDWQFFEGIMKYIRPHFKYVVLYTHIPPKTGDLKDNPKRKQTLESAIKMSSELKKYPVDLILTGHVHYFSKQDFGGIPLYTVPSSGQKPRGDIKNFGFVDVWITPQGIQVKESYMATTPQQELGDILFVDTILTDKIRYLGIGIILGIVLLFLSQKCKRKSK